MLYRRREAPFSLVGIGRDRPKNGPCTHPAKPVRVYREHHAVGFGSVEPTGFVACPFERTDLVSQRFRIDHLNLVAHGLCNGSISTVQLIGYFPVLLITFVASIYVLLRVPALTNHIFSGTSGGSSAQILQDFLA